jgi:hypothetical protein
MGDSVVDSGRGDGRLQPGVGLDADPGSHGDDGDSTFAGEWQHSGGVRRGDAGAVGEAEL